MGLTQQAAEFFHDSETSGQAEMDEIMDIRRLLRSRGVHVTSSGPACDFCQMNPATHVTDEFFVCDDPECIGKEGEHAQR